MTLYKDRESPSFAGLKVGIFHPWLGVGGSECGALWAAHTIQEQGGEVSIVGPSDVDFASLDSAFGTEIEASLRDRRIQYVPLEINARWRSLGFSAYLHQFGALARHADLPCDLFISAYNPIDFGKPAIQLIGDFTFDHEVNQLLDPEGTRKGNAFHSHVRDIARATCSRFFPKPDLVRLQERGDLFVAVSHWTRRVLREHYGIENLPILYPPVPESTPVESPDKVPWRFVYIGRISPEKRIERMIRILSEVRKEFPIEFRIVGGIPDNSYGHRIGQMVEANDWITSCGRLVGPEKLRELSSASFAIQGRDNEPFGIAVAEMAKAGCILFCPRNGGQFEIIERDELTFSDDAEAVERILHILSLSPEERQKWRELIVRQASRFPPSRFKREFTDIVTDYLAGRFTLQPAAL